jgi:hypothetical protein
MPTPSSIPLFTLQIKCSRIVWSSSPCRGLQSQIQSGNESGLSGCAFRGGLQPVSHRRRDQRPIRTHRRGHSSIAFEPPTNSVFHGDEQRRSRSGAGMENSRASAVPNVYILEGGVNNWIAFFGTEEDALRPNPMLVTTNWAISSLRLWAIATIHVRPTPSNMSIWNSLKRSNSN